jgi:PAS domain S-box-containing protein
MRSDIHNLVDQGDLDMISMEDGEALRLIYAAVQHVNDAVLITTGDIDPPGPRILYVNPAFTKMTGYSPEEVVGNTPRMFQGPQSDRSVLDRVRQALERGESFRGEIVNYRKDSSGYLLDWQIDPVRDPAGTITHWVAIQRDITSLKAAEKERAQLLQEAQAAIRVRDELLTAVSHELRTPLTSLVGYTYLLQRERTTAGRAAAQAQRAVQVIAGQVQRLNALIELLLDLERLQTGTLQLTNQLVDLRMLTEQVVAEYQLLLRPQQRLTLVNQPERLVVQGDELRLRHVLQQLVQNAIAYSPGGGAITLNLIRQGDEVHIVVHDEGVGVPQAAQAHLFERFYRAPNVDSLQASGFGIGLYVVHEIVTRHGGTVAVDSTEGHGSTFTVRLPLA